MGSGRIKEDVNEVVTCWATQRALQVYSAERESDDNGKSKCPVDNNGAYYAPWDDG